MFARRKPAPTYQILIYAIVPNLWRWEIRSDATLVRCGTAKTEADAELSLAEELNA